MLTLVERMNKKSTILYVCCALFACLLYFCTDVKTAEEKAIEKSRVLVKQSTSVESLIRDAHHDLSPELKNQLDEANVLMERATSDEERLQLKERLSSIWFAANQYAIAGHYAEQIAEERQDVESWSIAGTVFTQGIQREEDQKVKAFCADHAREAFNQALLIEPANPEAELNKALTFIYQPDESNPMAGIQMLLAIKKDYPDYAPVYRTLGRFAIQTGQYEKALERLRQAYSLEKDAGKVSCLMAQAFTAMEQLDSAAYYTGLCNKN